jgi:mRNA interferase RelE/StbE
MTKSYKIELTKSAAEDFKKLDGSIKMLVAKQLKALEKNPFKGEMLGNKAGIDLTGYYKLYVHKKQVRIVYQVINDKLVVLIVGIGKRDNLEVYADVLNKLK